MKDLGWVQRLENFASIDLLNAWIMLILFYLIFRGGWGWRLCVLITYLVSYLACLIVGSGIIRGVEVFPLSFKMVRSKQNDMWKFEILALKQGVVN